MEHTDSTLFMPNNTFSGSIQDGMLDIDVMDDHLFYDKFLLQTRDFDSLSSCYVPSLEANNMNQKPFPDTILGPEYHFYPTVDELVRVERGGSCEWTVGPEYHFYPTADELVRIERGGSCEWDDSGYHAEIQVSSPSVEDMQSSRIVMEDHQLMDEGPSLSLGHHKEQEPEEEFKVKTNWEITSWENTMNNFVINPGVSDRKHSNLSKAIAKGARKAGGGQKQTTTERTISLQLLRQYFAGSLKDAATSIGVCPTTLKRICRQHGITRWPSRKIKKVEHSLRKLQLIINSVQGSEGCFQLSSFYNNFPELNANIFETNPSTKKPEISLSSPLTPASNQATSCVHSSGSSLCYSMSTEVKEVHIAAKTNASDEKFQHLDQEEKLHLGSQGHQVDEYPSHEVLPEIEKKELQDGSSFRVKAAFGEVKIRFSMPHYWVLGDLKGEIFRRFKIEDTNKMELKYLDEDSEWILLKNNDDLDECIDIHRSSKCRTIKLSLCQAVCADLGGSVDA